MYYCCALNAHVCRLLGCRSGAAVCMEIVRDAANQLKTLYGGKGKMKLKLFISVKGIKLYHFQTMVSTKQNW